MENGPQITKIFEIFSDGEKNNLNLQRRDEVKFSRVLNLRSERNMTSFGKCHGQFSSDTVT